VLIANYELFKTLAGAPGIELQISSDTARGVFTEFTNLLYKGAWDARPFNSLGGQRVFFISIRALHPWNRVLKFSDPVTPPKVNYEKVYKPQLESIIIKKGIPKERADAIIKRLYTSKFATA
jgi:hypothetical protein